MEEIKIFEENQWDKAMKTMRDIGDLDSCILCGCMMHGEVERRYKQLQYIAWLVERSCESTPFVYQNIVSRAKDERESHIRSNPSDSPCQCNKMKKEEQSSIGNLNIDELCTKGDRAPFCIACINWVRRLSRSQQVFFLCFLI
jgi:hypothetical protein